MTDRFKLLEREVALELDQLCDQFEDAYRAGENPAIEDYLGRVSGEAYRSGLAMLLELELDLRRELGAPSEAASFFSRFPDHHDTVLEVLDAQRDTESENDSHRASFGLAASRLGRYQFAAGKPLGEGTFGKVYQACDTRLGRDVAIKVPRPNKLDKDLFLREARAISQLKHRNICTVYDVDEDDGRPYMVMELIEGPKLSEQLSKHRLPASEAVRIVYEVALALEHAHSQGIVHRDLKPANIMLRGGREPVVLDFGLAKVAAASETLMQANTALGTALYMPPEQATGDFAAVGPASDVYSLGMVLYEALTGELPFSGTMKSVLQQVKDQGVPDADARCPAVSPGLAAVCAKASAKRVKDRYASMAAFAEALRPYLPEGHPERVEIPPAAGSSTLRRLLALTAAAATAASIVIWFAWKPGNQAAPPLANGAVAQADAESASAFGEASPAQQAEHQQPASGAPPVGRSIEQPDLPPSLLEPTPPAPQDEVPSGPVAAPGESSHAAGAATPSSESPSESPMTGSSTTADASLPSRSMAENAAVEGADIASGSTGPPAQPGDTQPSAGKSGDIQPGDLAQPGGVPASKAQQIEALVQDWAKHVSDPEEEVPADVIQRSIDLGLGLFRENEEQRREFWEALTNRLRRRSGDASADDADSPSETRPGPVQSPPLNRPIRRFFAPKPR